MPFSQLKQMIIRSDIVRDSSAEPLTETLPLRKFYFALDRCHSLVHQSHQRSPPIILFKLSASFYAQLKNFINNNATVLIRYSHRLCIYFSEANFTVKDDHRSEAKTEINTFE